MRHSAPFILSLASLCVGTLTAGAVAPRAHIGSISHASAPRANSLDDFWWNGFALPGDDGRILAMIYDGGKIIVGGSFTETGLVYTNHVASWDGTAWHPLGPGVESWVSGFASYAAGIVAVGSKPSDVAGEAPTVRLWDGSSWTVLGSSDANVYALAVYNGDLVVAGSFSTINGVAASRIARWDGASWHPLAGGLDGTVYALAVHGTQLIAGGLIPSRQGAAAWDGTSWTQLGSGLQRSGYPNGTVYAVASIGGSLYAAGAFNKSGAASITSVAKWDGLQWTGLPGATGTLRALGEWGGLPVAGVGGQIRQWNGSSWVTLGSNAGSYDDAYLTVGSHLYASGVLNGSGLVGDMIVFDGSTWQSTQSWWAPGMAGLGGDYVTDLLAWNGQLISAGALSRPGQQDHWGVASTVHSWDGSAWSDGGPIRNDPSGDLCLASYQGDLIVSSYTTPWLNRWNGSAWSNLSPGQFDAEVYSLAPSGTDLYASGPFEVDFSQPGTLLHGIARWDGASWHPLGNGIDLIGGEYGAYADALLPVGNDLYLAGAFPSVGGGIPGTSNLARWDGASYHDVGGGVNGEAYALASFGGDLVVGGVFTQAGGQPAQGAARWNGSSWSAMGTNALEVYRFKVVNGRLFAVGEFVYPDASEAYALAMWDGQTWVPLGSGASYYITALEEFQGDLYVGGGSGWVNGKPSFLIARFQGLSQLAVGGPAVPDRLQLATPHPNPARGPMLVDYALPRAEHVRLGVYDLMGRRVALLVDTDRPAGANSAVWNGTDGRGVAAASGVYVLMLEAGGTRSTVRAVRLE